MKQSQMTTDVNTLFLQKKHYTYGINQPFAEGTSKCLAVT